MNVRSAADARKISKAGAKSGPDIRSRRLQAIYAMLEEKAELFSYVGASNSFPGDGRDSEILKGALKALGGDRSLKKERLAEVLKIFKKLGWPIPAEDEDDNSRRFGTKHGWNREVKRRVAELKKGSSAGGSDIVGIGPHDQAVLAATEKHLDSGAISDSALQDANRALKRCGKGA